MLPYFLLLLLTLWFAFMCENVKSKSVKLVHLYKSVIFILLWLFAGFRDSKIGTDTGAYVSRFESLDRNFIDTLLGTDNRLEIGYRLLEYFASLLSNQYVVILLLISFVTLFFQMKAINKLSENYLFSIFVFITFGIYTFVFNGARQAIAAGIFFFGIVHLIKGNWSKYILWILIASCFHKSVLICLPFYHFFRLEFTKKIFLLILFFAVVISVFMKSILGYASLISEEYSIYQDLNATGGAYLTLAFSLLSLFFVLFRPNVKVGMKKAYDIYLNLFLLGTVVYVVVFISGSYVEITRQAFYFLLSAVFIWPIIFKNLKQRQYLFFFVGFIGSHIYFFYIFIGKMANLAPYKFNLSIF